MRYSEFQEARKNPEQNPKTAINQHIIDAVNATDDYAGGTKNIFVSFTSVDKLGINPRSQYDTPIGIYAYPGEYVVDRIGPDAEMGNLPFAGESPYVNIFKAKGNIIDVSTITAEEVVPYYKKLAELWAKHSKGTWKESVDQIEAIINRAEDYAKFSNLPGGRLWYVTMAAANGFVMAWGGKKPVVWNRIFREIGIDGAVDSQGRGIIHTAEPTQAVFFSINAVTNVKRYENKYSPSSQEKRVELGKDRLGTAKDMAKHLNSMPFDELEDVLHFNGSELVRYIKDPKTRAKLISNGWLVFNKITNPTALEIAAQLTVNPEASFKPELMAKPEFQRALIYLVHNTPLDKQIEFLPRLIEKLEKQKVHISFDLQLAIAKTDPTNIVLIDHPHPKALKAAIASWDEAKMGRIPYRLKVLAGLPITLEDDPKYRQMVREINQAEEQIDYIERMTKEAQAQLNKLLASPDVDQNDPHIQIVIKQYQNRVKDFATRLEPAKQTLAKAQASLEAFKSSYAQSQKPR